MSEEMTTTVEVSADTTLKSLSDLKPKMKLIGTVKRLELYGAFIDVGVSVDALIHISQLGTETVNRIADVLNIGDQIEVWVDKVDPQRNQLMVTRIEPLAVDWTDLKDGQVYSGKVSRLENYGVFVNIGAEREGLVHISELSHDFVKHPKEVVNVGDDVEVKVLSFSKRKRRIDLSMKALIEKPEPVLPVFQQQQPKEEYYDEVEEYEDEDLPTAMEIAIRRAMGGRADMFSKGKGKDKRRRDRSRYQQDDILSRTLHLQK